jgi:hypothetical protein
LAIELWHGANRRLKLTRPLSYVLYKLAFAINQALKDPQKAKQISREINQAMTDAENKFRSLIEKGKVPQKDGRISWDNEQTEPIA